MGKHRFVGYNSEVTHRTNLHEEARGDGLADVLVVLRTSEFRALLLQLHIQNRDETINTQVAAAVKKYQHPSPN